MAISSNNVQVYTTLSKELVAEIDKDAKNNFRTRSQQINMILTEYYKMKTTTDDEKSKTLNVRKRRKHQCFLYSSPNYMAHENHKYFQSLN